MTIFIFEVHSRKRADGQNLELIDPVLECHPERPVIFVFNIKCFLLLIAYSEKIYQNLKRVNNLNLSQLAVSLSLQSPSHSVFPHGFRSLTMSNFVPSLSVIVSTDKSA